MGQPESQPFLMESCGKERLDTRNRVIAFITPDLKKKKTAKSNACSQSSFSSHVKHTFRPVGNDQLFQVTSPFGKILLADWKAQLLKLKKKKKFCKRNSTDNEPTSVTVVQEF